LRSWSCHAVSFLSLLPHLPKSIQENMWQDVCVCVSGYSPYICVHLYTHTITVYFFNLSLFVCVCVGGCRSGLYMVFWLKGRLISVFFLVSFLLTYIDTYNRACTHIYISPLSYRSCFSIFSLSLSLSNASSALSYFLHMLMSGSLLGCRGRWCTKKKMQSLEPVEGHKKDCQLVLRVHYVA
jgi:hypothetical protein